MQLLYPWSIIWGCIARHWWWRWLCKFICGLQWHIQSDHEHCWWYKCKMAYNNYDFVIVVNAFRCEETKLHVQLWWETCFIFDLQYYDVRKKCEGDLCYDFSSMETFLNQMSVRNALGVGDREFVSCSSDVYDAMLTDWMRNLEVGIPALVEDGIKVLVYAGEYDLICNWLGKPPWLKRRMKL